MWLILFYYICASVTVSAEVITLKTNRTITCVLSGNSVYSPLDIDPPPVFLDNNSRVSIKRPIAEIKNWIRNDWKKVSNDWLVPYDDIIDQRWEDFEDHGSGIKLRNVPQSFLACFPKGFSKSFKIQSGNFTQNETITVDDNIAVHENFRSSSSLCEWSLWRLTVNGRKITVQCKENETTHISRFDPVWFRPTSASNQVAVRIPKYDFYYSNRSSSDESSLKLNSSVKCISLYVSLCQDCYLDIRLEDKITEIFTRTINSTNEDDFKKWQRIEMQTKLNDTGTLSFRRRKEYSGEGYWAIDDIQICKSKIDIYRINSLVDLGSQVCRELKVVQTGNFFCSKLGYVGQHCNIRCKEVLGEQYSYCQNHTICSNRQNCHCAWGYQGKFCNETCADGRWGLNCRSTCDSNRMNCSHIYGSTGCKRKFFGDQCSDEFPVLRNAPVVTAISKNSVKIMQTVEYGQNETKPKYYQIQIKKDEEKMFNNYTSEIHNFTLRNEILEIRNISVQNSSYTIRIILLVDEQHGYVDGVPELVIYKTSINATFFDNEIEVTWDALQNIVYNYTLKYECQEFNSTEATNNTISSSEHHAKIIDNAKHFVFCKIDLFAAIENKNQLIDQIEIRRSNLIYSNESPENITRPVQEKLISEGPSTTITMIFFIIVIITIIIRCITIVIKVIAKLCRNDCLCDTRKRQRGQKKNKIKMCEVEVLTQSENLGSNLRAQRETLIQSNSNRNSINYNSNAFTPTSIKIEMYENYLRRSLGNVPNTTLSHQFKSLPASTKPIIYARQDKNKNKNKDNQNLPYDESRVILTEMEGMGTSDYINASFIDGFDCPKAYIATQGPKFFTIKDFWRMIWQHEIETIVMATNFIEGKIRKCAEYFPQKVSTVFQCGKMSIKLANVNFYEHYVQRSFKIYYEKYCRRVQHLQLKWNPNNGSPLYPDHLVPLIKRISSIRDKSNSPIVIHCSSGVNRTGALILIDLALHMAKSANRVDFLNLTLDLRNQRPNIISSEKLYLLAHLVVLECLTEEEKHFKKTLTENLHSSVLQSQLKHLEKLSEHDRIVQSWSNHTNGLHECSLPHTLAHGYAKLQKYLVTKLPNKNSVHDFWDVVAKEKIKIILLVDSKPIVQNIWPYQKQKPRRNVRVMETKSYTRSHYDLRQLSLSINQLPSNKIIFENTIYVFQMKSKNTNGLLQLVNDIIKHYTSNSSRPILVACNDGITTSGQFIALSYIVKKYQKELEVDICSAVRCIRRSGTKFINTKEQLKFLYTAFSEYQKMFDVYTSAL